LVSPSYVDGLMCRTPFKIRSDAVLDATCCGKNVGPNQKIFVQQQEDPALSQLGTFFVMTEVLLDTSGGGSNTPGVNVGVIYVEYDIEFSVRRLSTGLAGVFALEVDSETDIGTNSNPFSSMVTAGSQPLQYGNTGRMRVDDDRSFLFTGLLSSSYYGFTSVWNLRDGLTVLPVSFPGGLAHALLSPTKGRIVTSGTNANERANYALFSDTISGNNSLQSIEIYDGVLMFVFQTDGAGRFEADLSFDTTDGGSSVENANVCIWPLPLDCHWEWTNDDIDPPANVLMGPYRPRSHKPRLEKKATPQEPKVDGVEDLDAVFDAENVRLEALKIKVAKTREKMLNLSPNYPIEDVCLPVKKTGKN